MSFFVQTGPDERARLSQQLGQALGGGFGKAIGENIANKKQLQQQAGLAQLLFGNQAQGDPQAQQRMQQFSQLPPEVQLEAYKAMQPKAPAGGLTGQATPPEVGKAISEVLNANKEADADTLAQAFDQAGVPRTFANSYIENRRQTQKPVFEPESEKLEAKRVSDLATGIEKDFLTARNENIRLDRMQELSNKETVSTPAMIAGLEKIGLPIGILSNPDTEEYRKLETDFIRDARDVFPGGRITNYEIQSYLKTIPTLSNSKEGREVIIRNRKLLNDAKLLRYDEYKKILKENNGKKPPNMGVILEERIADRMLTLEDQFKEGLDKITEKYQTPIRMKDPQGRIINIPPGKIQQALEAGATF